MRLSAAARYFDNSLCYDAYTLDLLFKGQVLPFDGGRRDGMTVERRIVSLSPEAYALVPARRAIRIDGTPYILGKPSPDQFRGRTVRVGVVGHQAEGEAQIRTLAQACRGEAGTTALAACGWVGESSTQSSEGRGQYRLYFSASEAVPTDSLVVLGNRTFLVQAEVASPQDILTLLAEELREPAVQNAVFSAQVTDPATEVVSTLTTPTKVVVVPWRSLFAYGNPEAPAFGPDDAQMAVEGSALTPKPGMQVTLPGGSWAVRSCHLHSGVWLCRVTKHG